MKTRCLTQWICAGLLVGPLIGANALAQDSIDQRWFKVELLVFKHAGADNERSEQWEPTPLLAYPQDSRFLLDADRIQANAELHNAISTVNEFGQQTLTMLAEPDPLLDPQDGAAAEILPLLDPLPVDEIIEPLTEPVDEPPAAPSPFIALPFGELELRGKAAYMQRSGRYQTLWHEAWLQTVATESLAVPIVLDLSGDTGQWPELQGTIKLYLSRYLHVETNLWLNTQGSYLSSDWRMPAPPLGPTSLIIVELPEPEPPVEPELQASQNSEIEFDNVQTVADTEALEFIEQGPVYPFRHAVLLHQKRRMRSNETHYIDHPMLGLVIRFTPVEQDELEQRALAEREANSVIAAQEGRDQAGNN